MNNDPLDEMMNTQFELSYELLHFLRWLLEQENEHKALKALIQRALLGGLKKSTNITRKKGNSEDIQGLQYGLIEFFGLLDTLIYETMHENTLEQAAQKKLTQTIQQIDGTLCDDITLHDSIAKTTDEMERCPEKSPKTVLCETLLKQWRPAKGNDTN